MTSRKPRYSKEEFARRGDEIYETQVRLGIAHASRSQVKIDFMNVNQMLNPG
jgi:hypothetical protein